MASAGCIRPRRDPVFGAQRAPRREPGVLKIRQKKPGGAVPRPRGGPRPCFLEEAKKPPRETPRQGPGGCPGAPPRGPRQHPRRNPRRNPDEARGNPGGTPGGTPADPRGRPKQSQMQPRQLPGRPRQLQCLCHGICPSTLRYKGSVIVPNICSFCRTSAPWARSAPSAAFALSTASVFDWLATTFAAS